MRYVSTRGEAPTLSFDDALLAGLARDGGLYVPESWPRLPAIELKALAGRPYAEIAFAVLRPFVGGTIADNDLAAMIDDAYRGFGHPAVAPLKQLDADDWLLELFHGPTLAFKDYALQLVGRMFDHVLAAKGRRATIVGATSGDTGSAAIEACRDRAAIDIFILHPKGRVSEVQRRQMTTVQSANVHNIAVEGTFDDCQDLVKGMFADAPFREAHSLSAVNSINWARIAAQVVYYVSAALSLGAPARKIAFAVPTGNFGNVYAAYVAAQMGLPIRRLVIGSNRNDILARLLATGEMKVASVEPSLSPSMDIQVSSNFERLLFDLAGSNGAAVAKMMARFRRRGALRLSPARHRRLGRLFEGGRADDRETLAAIERIYKTTGELVDPHSAVGLHTMASAQRERGVPMVALACAHPAKFPDAVERATGVRPHLPARLGDLLTRPERMTALPNDLRAVEDFVRGRVRVAA
ncbi:MAG: threonine synthase [Rhodospirillales bacterium]|nr:threonine synthase [Rhodospirillales bacterium]